MPIKRRSPPQVALTSQPHVVPSRCEIRLHSISWHSDCSAFPSVERCPLLHFFCPSRLALQMHLLGRLGLFASRYVWLLYMHTQACDAAHLHVSSIDAEASSHVDGDTAAAAAAQLAGGSGPWGSAFLLNETLFVPRGPHKHLHISGPGSRCQASRSPPQGLWPTQHASKAPVRPQQLLQCSAAGLPG